jgi:hypothetical protein
VTASADDYLWFSEDYPLGLNFCATLVRALNPDEVIAVLGGTDAVDIAGAHRLDGAAEQVGPSLPRSCEARFTLEMLS